MQYSKFLKIRISFFILFFPLNVKKPGIALTLFRFPVERETGFEPATPTLARLYSTPEPLAHLLIFILLSARCTLQMILYRNSPHLSIPIFNFFQKKYKSIYDSLNFRSPSDTRTAVFPPTNSHRTTLLTNPDSFPSVLPTSHTHADPPPSGSRPLSTPHAHADPPPGGSRRFTPVPTVRPRAASYLRCSGHEAARSRPRSSVFTSTPSESRSAHTDYLRSFSAKYPRV